MHCSWSIVSNLENDPASGYSLTPIIQIRIITLWIFYTILLVMHLGMRLALSWVVIVLQWQNSIHSKLFTAVFLSRQLFPGLYSNIWFFCPQCNILFLLLLKFTLLITNHVSDLLRSVFNPVSQSFCTPFPFLLTCKRDILTYVHLLHELYWLFLLPVLPRAEWIWFYSREIQFF